MVPDITLNNGVTIPQLGFGMFKVPPDEAFDTARTAIEVGYRHLDTAQMYGNEAGVGAAVRESGLPREDFFVTSKLNNGYHDPDDALTAFEQTLATLDIGYLDLFLIHWPLPKVGDFLDTWHAMETIYSSGKVRAIGVSNFEPDHLQRVLDGADVVPAVNQVEIHPYLIQQELRAFNEQHGIATEAWSPIARGKVLDDPAVRRVAEEVGQAPSQVVLRWHIQRGDIVFPKSSHRDRMVENFDIFGFSLDPDQMDAITALDRGERTGPHPDVFNWIPD